MKRTDPPELLGHSLVARLLDGADPTEGKRMLVSFDVDGRRLSTYANICRKTDALLGEVLSIQVNDDPAQSSFDVFVPAGQWEQLSLAEARDGEVILQLPARGDA